jgi:hypothetical protein
LSKDGRRKSVAPALVVPIIHVLSEDDCAGVQFAKKLVGGRTTGATFGSEQFYQDRNSGGGVVSGGKEGRQGEKRDRENSRHAKQP